MSADTAECDECGGEGQIDEEDVRKCHNCDGRGSCPSGANVFVCPVCSGEGEVSHSRRVACRACRGTGRIAQAPVRVVGRAAADDSDSDSGRAGARPAGKAKAKAKSRARAGDAPRGREERDEERGAAGDAQCQRGRGRGLRWEPNVGLVIDVTVTINFFLNCGGMLLLLVGLVLLAQDLLVWTVLGAMFVFVGILLILRANAERCKAVFQPLAPLFGQGADGGGGRGGSS
mmetsp:Transcript_7491/g.21349  ORF Transcript_7491/g.21349 Transcript_7491/m.21349 type:complete len:231 (-) Transcript_7491:100-792(-)